MGKILSYKHGEDSVKGVDPRLWDIVQAAIGVSPYDAVIRSGAEKRGTNGGNHNPGWAVDVTLVDPKTGERLPDYQNGKSFSAYEQFAQAARVYQTQTYPDLNNTLRWGGYFSKGGKATGYGAVDLMHLDINPNAKGAMALGSWDRGASSTLLSAYPDAQTNGGLSGADGSRLVSQYQEAFTNKGRYAPPAGLPGSAPMPMPARPFGSTAPAPPSNIPQSAMYGVRREPGAKAPGVPDGYDPFAQKTNVGTVDNRLMSMLAPKSNVTPTGPQGRGRPALPTAAPAAPQLSAAQRSAIAAVPKAALPAQVRPSGVIPTVGQARVVPMAAPRPASVPLPPVTAPTMAETMSEQAMMRAGRTPSRPAAAAPMPMSRPAALSTPTAPVTAPPLPLRRPATPIPPQTIPNSPALAAPQTGNIFTDLFNGAQAGIGNAFNTVKTAAAPALSSVGNALMDETVKAALGTKAGRTAIIDGSIAKVMNGQPKPTAPAGKPAGFGSKGYSAAGLALKNMYRRKK